MSPFPPRTAPNSTRASAAAQQLRLPSDAARLEAATDVALFFALWGEAANLRLVPEALCFLFHKMSNELRRADALGVEPVRSEGAFLKCVVQPVYKVRNSGVFIREWIEGCMMWGLHHGAQAAVASGVEQSKFALNERKSFTIRNSRSNVTALSQCLCPMCFLCPTCLVPVADSGGGRARRVGPQAQL
jgi:hypothetical protein